MQVCATREVNAVSVVTQNPSWPEVASRSRWSRQLSEGGGAAQARRHSRDLSTKLKMGRSKQPDANSRAGGYRGQVAIPARSAAYSFRAAGWSAGCCAGQNAQKLACRNVTAQATLVSARGHSHPSTGYSIQPSGSDTPCAIALALAVADGA